MSHALPPSPTKTVEFRQAPTDRLTVVDIGARGGLHPRWTKCSVVVQGVGFDADESECARLNARGDGVLYLPYALGSADGAKAILRITDSPGSSSLLQPNSEVLDHFIYGSKIAVRSTVPVTLTTLDTACERHDIQPDVIKMDIQGAELDVLKGSTRAMENALLIESEVEFQRLYVGQPLFRDIDAFMADKGWMILGLRRDFWRRAIPPSPDGGTLAHADVLYMNPARLESITESNALPILAALAAYRQADYAHVLANRIGRPEWVEGLVRRASLTQRLVGSVLSKLGTHRALRAWLDGCRRSNATDWHDPDFF
jgi:FkbM family methyltransferase